MGNKELIAALRAVRVPVGFKHGKEVIAGTEVNVMDTEYAECPISQQAAQALEAQEWQDISTPPDSGATCLVYSSNTGIQIVATRMGTHWLHGNTEVHPTHWKPLTPPETE